MLAYSKKGKLQCPMRHPDSDGVPRNRNFDVILLALNDPTVLDRPPAETEPYATDRENEYRQYAGVPLVPPNVPVRPAVRKKKEKP